MKIRKLVLLAIKGSADIKKGLMEALDVSQPTLSRFIRDNDENLTKAASMKVIREKLNLTDEEILENETAFVGEKESQN